MQVQFLKSTNDYNNCPVPIYPEFAFIGRSNVGKSSLINMLANRKNLAHTSSRPGKTQTINHYLFTYIQKEVIKKNISWYVADLPGYGYAQVSQEKKKQLEKLIAGYILTRKNLLNLFVLIDSRLEPQSLDLGFLNFLGENNIPFTLIFTKIDKISKTKLENNIKMFEQKLLQSWEKMPPYLVTSSKEHKGREELITYITKNIELYWKN